MKFKSASSNIWVTSSNPQAQIHDLRVRLYEKSSNPPVKSLNRRVASSNPQIKYHKLRVRIHELRFQIHKLRVQIENTKRECKGACTHEVWHSLPL